MKVTIHQPEHFPYLGFFQKMNEADLFIVLDNVQFRKNYFQNRNRFPGKSGSEEWFTVPIQKESHSKLIKDVKTAEDPVWRKKLVRKIQQNFGVDLGHIYDANLLIDINMASIKWCMKEMRITTPLIMASEVCNEGTRSELLANLVRGVGGTHYVSGPSGVDYLDMTFFEGIEVSFFQPKVENYYSSLYNIKILQEIDNQ